MENAKQKIAEILGEIYELDDVKIFDMFETPKEKSQGDLALVCFRLASIIKKSPQDISREIECSLNYRIKELPNVAKIMSAGPYVNFYIDVSDTMKEILTECLTCGIENKKYIELDEGVGKTICIDYSSPNIAKPFHMGHLRTTVIGAALYNMYKAMGYNVVGINHLGDFGTQFGYVIEGYKMWKDKYDLSHDAISQLVEIYVKINAMAKEDETIVEAARNNFIMLENKDKETVKLWEYFRALSLEEYKRVYKKLGIQFDSYNGEAFYNDKMQEIVDILNNKKVLVESEGARVVNISDEVIPCMILKSNGSTTYATRDLAAILYRTREYDFTKCLYVTGVEQMLHFRQVFEVAKYIVDKKYVEGLKHVTFGMVLGAGGKKLSTRKGGATTIDDVLNEAIDKAREIITKKGKVENEAIENTAELIGIGSIIFNDLKNSRNKDEIFDLEDMLKFEGETAPYVQYTCVRTKSIIEKSNYVPSLEDIQMSEYASDTEKELIKSIGKSREKLKLATDEMEPYIITRYVLEIATLFSRFYNSCQVLCENEKLQKARLALVYATKTVLEEGLALIKIQCPNKM